MHWSAVVAASGGDRVTLEDDNREEELSGLRQQRYDTLKADKDALGIAACPSAPPTRGLKASLAPLNPVTFAVRPEASARA